MVQIVHFVEVLQVSRGVKVVKVIFTKKHVSNFLLSNLFSYLFIACKAFDVLRDS